MGYFCNGVRNPAALISFFNDCAKKKFKYSTVICKCFLIFFNYHMASFSFFCLFQLLSPTVLSVLPQAEHLDSERHPDPDQHRRRLLSQLHHVHRIQVRPTQLQTEVGTPFVLPRCSRSPVVLCASFLHIT